MAIFTEDGKLETLETTDLIAYLATVDGSEQIDMWDETACLGQRATALLLREADGTVPYIEYQINVGNVKGKDEQYMFTGSDAVGAVINSLLKLQEARGLYTPLTAGVIRAEVNRILDDLIEVWGWSETL